MRLKLLLAYLGTGYSGWQIQEKPSPPPTIQGELEAALRAADGHLELNAPEEAFGELRRAQVQVETLAWLSHRIL